MKILVETAGARASVTAAVFITAALAYAAGAITTQVTGVKAHCPVVFPKKPERYPVL